MAWGSPPRAPCWVNTGNSELILQSWELVLCTYREGWKSWTVTGLEAALCLMENCPHFLVREDGTALRCVLHSLSETPVGLAPIALLKETCSKKHLHGQLPFPDSLPHPPRGGLLRSPPQINHLPLNSCLKVSLWGNPIQNHTYAFAILPSGLLHSRLSRSRSLGWSWGAQGGGGGSLLDHVTPHLPQVLLPLYKV